MILRCAPIFQKRLWGGRKLASQFDYMIPDGNIGECWGISGHTNGMSVISEGRFEGYTLETLWSDYRSLFGPYTLPEFPILVKILDANQKLSVQVHPSDVQASLLEGERYGKTECWYILEAEEGAEIILGHTASTKDGLRDSVNRADWETLLRKRPVRTGDFIFVPSGTVHAIGEGIVILETQQSSDTTYRLYDFDRIGEDGQKRTLHLDRALAVVSVPDQPEVMRADAVSVAGGKMKTLIQKPEFNVYHVTTDDGFTFHPLDRFRMVTIVKGSGKIEDVSVQAGDHLIVTRGDDRYTCHGQFEFIMSDVELQ